MCAQITPTNTPEANDEQAAEKVPWPLSRPAVIAIVGIVFVEMALLVFLGYDDAPAHLMLSLIPGMKTRFMCASGMSMLAIGLALRSIAGDILAIAGELVLVFTAIEWALVLFGL